jgi:predicted nucleic acid-binding protein
MRWTVDASVAVKWFIPEALSHEAAAWLDDDPEIFVPDLFFAEIPNVLWKKVLRRELSAAEARAAHQRLGELPYRVVSDRAVAVAALELAFTLRRSAYDCLYLAVAAAFDAPLVTADRKLNDAVLATSLARKVRWIGDDPRG